MKLAAKPPYTCTWIANEDYFQLRKSKLTTGIHYLEIFKTKTTQLFMETKDGKQAVYAATRAEWRKWLQKNSQTEKSVWLILYHKKSKTQSINLNDATEEALCFGWIDSLCKNRDAESFYLTFTPRNPKKSKWSAPNRERAARMITQGLMTEHGQNLIDIAKETGKWEEAGTK
ncbi:MAG: hypothetical protein ABIN67_17935 [Ferruginibacter sp.]